MEVAFFCVALFDFVDEQARESVKIRLRGQAGHELLVGKQADKRFVHVQEDAFVDFVDGEQKDGVHFLLVVP